MWLPMSESARADGTQVNATHTKRSCQDTTKKKKSNNEFNALYQPEPPYMRIPCAAQNDTPPVSKPGYSATRQGG